MLVDLAEHVGQRTGDTYTLPEELTQGDLARMVGLNRSTVSRFINWVQAQGTPREGREGSCPLAENLHPVSQRDPVAERSGRQRSGGVGEVPPGLQGDQRVKPRSPSGPGGLRSVCAHVLSAQQRSSASHASMLLEASALWPVQKFSVARGKQA